MAGEIAKLLPRVKYNVKPVHRKLSNPDGPLGRVQKISKVLTSLFQNERIEVLHRVGDEVRGYAERLITEAIRNGDCHKRTMELADFWLTDKNMIHKLFNVYAPRYKHYQTSYTAMYLIPTKYYLTYTLKRCDVTQEAVLELKGNPFPPMPRILPADKNSLVNVLLKEASKDFRKKREKI